MNRQGTALMMALVMFAAVGLVAAGEASAYVIRSHGLRDRAVRLQAIELALAARALPNGSTLAVGIWQVTHQGDDAVASSPAGSATVSGSSVRFHRSRP